MARGHLCSAVWRDLDPERPILRPPADAAPSPFTWIDGQALLSAEDLARFSPADLRTDYVPLVPVSSPEREWHAQGDPPELRPEALSELWDANELVRALRPL